MYPASVIAYAFVKKGIEEGKYVTQMKLQKLVYFAHGLHLALYGEPLVNESFQAWKFGPVIPSIYQSYKLYGSSPIVDPELSFLFDGGGEPNLKVLDAKTQSTINTTWEMLKDLSALKLSNWSHSEGSPWKNNYVPGVSDMFIPNNEIKEYFSKEFITK